MGKKFQVSHFSFQLFSILPWWDIKIKNKNKWPTVYFDKTKCPIHIMLWNKIKELRKIQGFSLRSLTELSLCRGLTCIKKKKNYYAGLTYMCCLAASWFYQFCKGSTAQELFLKRAVRNIGIAILVRTKHHDIVKS